jgi:DNA-binding transcriptional LysR family regulator
MKGDALELRQLKSFRVVAETLSFTRAAKQLGYVQSAITSHIQALEKDLGVKLFDRLGKRVVLTDAGKHLLGYARRITELAEEAQEVVAGDKEPAGSLRVSAPEVLCTYRLPAVIKEFRERYPQVGLIFSPSVTGALDAGLRHDLGAGAVDLAFVLDRTLGGGEFVVEELVYEPLVLVAPPEHPLARKTQVSPADLEGEPVLLTDKGCGYRALFEHALDRAGIHPEATVEFTSGEAIKQCVMNGLGIAVLAAVSVAREVEQGRLVALRWDQPDFGLTTQMVRHKDKWPSPALEALYGVARETLKHPAVGLPA